MRLTSMQFDGGGDTLPANPPKTIAPSPLAAKESGSIGATSMASQMAAASAPAKPKNSEYRGNAGGIAAKAKAPVDKSGYDRSVKVSQATVDAVKKDGAKVAANKVTYGSPGYDGSTFSPTAPVSKEYKEATKRVYPNAKSTPPNASGATNPNQPGPKAAAPKAAAPKSAFPPILPAPSKPKATPKPNSAAALPPLMTPPTPKASAPKANTKVKVSQATVDAVKSQGKAKAISNAKSNVTNAEYKEAVKRIYQSPAKPKPKAKSGGGGGKTSSAVK
jgi:hypothetical protein